MYIKRLYPTRDILINPALNRADKQPTDLDSISPFTTTSTGEFHAAREKGETKKRREMEREER